MTDEVKMPELKPCPFCGNCLSLFAGYYNHQDSDCWFNITIADKPDAIEKWNTRAATPADKAKDAGDRAEALKWLDKIQASYVLALSTVQKKPLSETDNCDALFEPVRAVLTAPKTPCMKDDLDIPVCLRPAAPDYTEQLRGVIHDIERNVRRFELLGGFNKNGASTQAGATELRAALTTLQSIINEG